MHFLKERWKCFEVDVKSNIQSYYSLYCSGLCEDVYTNDPSVELREYKLGLNDESTHFAPFVFSKWAKN